MYTLRLFGGFALLDESELPVRGLEQRAEAVLACLAITGDVGITRDRLVALLWSECDEATARHRLRSALYLIRRCTGNDTVQNVSTRLRLDSTFIDADVVDFDRAIGEKNPERAAALYRGFLLDGFHVDDAPEFERWVEEHRGRRHRECAEALETLARQADGVSGPHGGVAWWMRMAEHEPHNSRVAIRLMRALAAAGDRATALHQAELHRRRLLEDLDIAPGAQFDAEVERLKSVGS